MSLILRLDMRWVAQEATVAGLGDGARVTLWDAAGRVLLRHPDPEGFLGRDARDSEVWRAIVASNGEGTAEAAGGDGVPRLYGFTRLPDISGQRIVLSLGVPVDVAFAELRGLERRNLLVLLLVAVVASGVAWLGAERFVRLFGRLQRLSERDALTGLANRRHLLTLGEDELRRASRFGHTLAAMMLDVDHFKGVNDRHGHGAGDDVLAEVARRVQAIVRETDVATRYGGEEFAVLLPETTLETAHDVAERIRRSVADTAVATRKGAISVTLSAGVAVIDAAVADLKGLLDAADAALYRAKSEGRNRVVSAGTTAPTSTNHLREPTESAIRDAALDETIEASFPASDPPSSLPNPADRGAIDRLEDS